MNIIIRVRSFYWSIYLRLRGAHIGKAFCVEGPLRILLRDGAQYSNISIGENVTFGGTVYIRVRKNGKLILGNRVRTGTDVWLVTANDSEFIVGDNTILGTYAIMNGGHGLAIGANSIFAAFVYINTSDHGFQRNELIQNQGFIGAPISIGSDVWIGGHVFVNKGVTIGDGAVIGAGAIVVKDVLSNTIIAGNPAKKIKERE